MRWRTAGLCVVSLVVMTGCPDTYGRDGRLDQATHEDLLELLRENCSEEDFNAYCAQGRERSPECLAICGGP
jgi:hypothetical protein